MKTDFPIDAVITWVDGDDPAHIAKREKYGSSTLFKTEDIAGLTRYKSLGEIFYCIASINKFASWIRKIYIVTDAQNPNVEPYLKEHFPNGYIPMEIVDHKVIFDGYHKYLPTFNSISIESMTWRIPGLSEHYLEFNDDLILQTNVSPSDFFTPDGKPVCYAQKKSALIVALTRQIKYWYNGRRKVSYKQTMVNALKRMERPTSFILKVHHTPKSLRKSFFENYYKNHHEALEENISHRFRDASQFNPQQLMFLTMYQNGECELKSYYPDLLYIQCREDDEYIQKKLEVFKTKPNAKFICINSMDKATERGSKMLVKWIESFLWGVS